MAQHAANGTFCTYLYEQIIHRQRTVWKEQNVRMQGLGKRLRDRAQELELSDAEVARRTGLSSRRYGHYVVDRNEPDLATLLRLCEVLNTSPSHLLGTENVGALRGRRRRLTEQIAAALALLDESGLELANSQVQAIVKHRRIRGEDASEN